MIRNPSLLKQIALEGVLLAGLGGVRSDIRPPLPQRTATFSLLPRVPESVPLPPTEREKAFRDALGVTGAKRSDSLTDNVALLRLSFGTWPVPGVDSHPELVRHIPVEVLSAFDGTMQTGEADTGGAGSMNKAYRNVFETYFPKVAATLFQPPQITARLLPLDRPENVQIDMSMEGHEAIHSVFRQTQIFLDYLYNRPDMDELDVDGLSRSELIGVGPEMDALMAASEKPAQTHARHEQLFKLINDGNPFTQNSAQDDGQLTFYPAFYTEMQAYSHQVVAAGISSGAWKAVPQDKGELWAAFYNAVGGFPLQPEADEVSAFLTSEAGKKALAAFPAPPQVIAQKWLRKDVDLLSAPNKSKFYSQVLPKLYGELLEIYGDPNGMVKMGLPASPLATLSFANHVVRAGMGGEQDWSPAEWKTMAAQIDPKTFQKMGALAVASHNTEAVQALLETAEQPRSPFSLDKNALLQGAFKVMISSTDANQRAAREAMTLLVEHGADQNLLPQYVRSQPAAGNAPATDRTR